MPNANSVEWEAGRFGGVADCAPIEVNPFLADLGMIDELDCFESALPANLLVWMAEIIDSTSNTLLAEASGRPRVAWSSPLSPAGLRQVFGGRNDFHRGGTTACMVDGSGRFIPDSTDIRVLGRLATRAGGAVVGGW